MRETWLIQPVSPGLKLQGLAEKFGALSAFVLPPSHVDHPHRLVMGFDSSMDEGELQEELDWGNNGKYVVGYCKEEWGADYPLNDVDFVPLQLDDPLLQWAMKRSPTGPNGFDTAAADAWVAEHPGEYFFRHSSQLPKWPQEGQRVALRARPLEEISVAAREYPWKWRLSEAALPEDQDWRIALTEQANARMPVSASEATLYQIMERHLPHA